ncbi:patatin-like phospholipase family protein [Alkalilimnicola sp. S0819]|uniref:patatin-like phospholipase family protein n=1 Tax=Alkalilimnicola sp. S0819 TaxID=2613922 RepID=UPI0012625B9F|nr:patatin-like phospholipase family protein [Alkalilimnicola sp. S0819]KAB7628298.1 patatin-like phospholipase family protein [Alkalilimnicola sp. S0819]MPQ15195.1 patatin-like phospholipase family protein [Alkalilimnicola sp. S0819]
MKGLSPRRRLPLKLALQGGGSHGAFTWGVLDRLLEEPWFSPAGLSGASAGAVNAALFASGWAQDGAEGARAALRGFWEQVGAGAHTGPLFPTVFDYLLHGWNRDSSPRHALARKVGKLASPYQLNPADLNPLRSLLDDWVDPQALRDKRCPPLYIALSNVHDSGLRLVGNSDLSTDALLASACLPLLFQAVEVDGEYYWDGGYTANPPLMPLIRDCPGRDLLLVQLNPRWQAGVPTTVDGIMHRINEIGFQANMLRELQLIAELHCEPRNRWLPATGLTRRIRQLRFHRLELGDAAQGAGHTSPMNTEWPFLKHLHHSGRERAGQWLQECSGLIGRVSTTPLSEAL